MSALTKEIALASCRGPADEIEFIDRVVEMTERRCYCVEMQ